MMVLFAILAIFASLQSVLLGLKQYKESDWQYPSYNNYLIFKQSFYHLIHHQDLYQHYPAEHWDLYKYTPTFSLLFGAFAVFPDLAGLSLWNLLNALLLVIAVFLLPALTAKQKTWIVLVCVIESMTAMQNEQSNGLLAGLFVLAFALYEKQKFFWAIACLTLATFIKPFGLAGFVLMLFYPDKLKHIGYTLISTALLLFLPLLVISMHELGQQYQSWLNVLSEDQSLKYGYSVAGWLHSWFNFNPPKNLITLIGLLIFLLPLSQIRQYKEYHFRLLTLASLLIWVVIFNHMAESPTFIIAMTGIAIWFFSKEPSALEIVLFALAFFLVSLSPTDIIPHHLRRSFFRPYVLKAIPCILIWGKIIYDQWLFHKNSPKSSTAQLT